MRFEIYRDHTGGWRWRLRSQNGNVVADSAEAYVHRGDCERGIELVKSSASAPTVDMTTKVAEPGSAPRI
jgi:uncharacterized protein YegP (UPF0339 family)